MKLFGKQIEILMKGRKRMQEQPRGAGGGEQNRIAIFGDVHANLEALNAVLKDARGQEITRFACTGDLVGYGPNPAECLELVKKLNCPIVRGNHDEYAATDISLKDFTLNAMNALIWTREHLTAEERAWLNGLPMEWGETTHASPKAAQGGQECTEHTEDVLTTHASPKAAQGKQKYTKDTKEVGTDRRAVLPVEGEKESRLTAHGSFSLVHSSVVEPAKWRYIIKQEEAEQVLPAQQQELVFFGHTHVFAVYAFQPDTGEFRSTVPSPEGICDLTDGWKYLVNPGSVGQPRDHDPRAAYIVYDPAARTVEQRRVEYDFKTTARKIVEAGLPERNAQRLYKGK